MSDLKKSKTTLPRPAECRLNPSAEFIFPEQRLRYLKGASELTDRFKAIFESCAIATTQAATGDRKRAIVRVGFHSLRHSFVSLCGKSGTSTSVIQGIVGHGSPAMTEIYMHLDEGQKLLATSLFPDILSGLADNLSKQNDQPPNGKGENSDKIGVDDKNYRNNPINPATAGSNGDSQTSRADTGCPSQPRN